MNHQKVIKNKNRDITINNYVYICTTEEVSAWPPTSIYMYAFMYVYPKTIPVEYHFPATKTFVCKLQENYQNIGLDLVTYFHKIMS